MGAYKIAVGRPQKRIGKDWERNRLWGEPARAPLNELFSGCLVVSYTPRCLVVASIHARLIVCLFVCLVERLLVCVLAWYILTYVRACDLRNYFLPSFHHPFLPS